MGDISELRALIVLFVVITVSIALIAYIPSQFFISNTQNQPTPDVDISKFIAWNSTYVLNLTGSYTWNANFELNEYNFFVYVYNVGGQRHILMYTASIWWLFQWDYDPFRWIDKNNVDITETGSWEGYLAATTINNYANPVEFTAKNGRTQAKVTFSYNESLYSSFDDALINDDAFMIFFVDWNDRATSMNAFQIIGMVLTGSLPDMHPVLTFIFGFIGWAFVAAGIYLAFIFTLRLLGAVFGGGGA